MAEFYLSGTMGPKLHFALACETTKLRPEALSRMVGVIAVGDDSALSIVINIIAVSTPC